MSGSFWCEECTKWVEESDVHETVVEVNKDRGDKGTVYEHDLCGSQVTPGERY